MILWNVSREREGKKRIKYKLAHCYSCDCFMLRLSKMWFEVVKQRICMAKKPVHQLFESTNRQSSIEAQRKVINQLMEWGSVYTHSQYEYNHQFADIDSCIFMCCRFGRLWWCDSIRKRFNFLSFSRCSSAINRKTISFSHVWFNTNFLSILQTTSCVARIHRSNVVVVAGF